MIRTTNKPKHRAFSLLEVVVSIGIVGVILVMLNSVIINTAIVAQKASARSFVREEVAEIVDRISSDIREADQVQACSGNITTGVRCVIHRDKILVWTNCGTSVCQSDSSGNVLYRSSDNVKIVAFGIEEGLGQVGNVTKRNLLITLAASHSNDKFEVKNIVRQTAVSTRNYLLK